MGRLTPLDIRKMEFKQSALGFSREQVTQYLETVADEVEELIREGNELRKENGKLQEKLSSYRSVEQSMNEALVLAKDSAKKTTLAAQKEADAVLQKAATEKDALLFSAKQELGKLQSDIHAMKIRRDGILMKLRTILQNHLDVINHEFEDNREAPAEAPLVQNEGDERIIDFSQPDVSFADLEEEAEEDDSNEEELPPEEPTISLE